MMRTSYVLLTVVSLAALAASTPVEKQEVPAEARAVPDAPHINPSPPDPLQKRDGAHHGGGSHASSFSSVGTSSYATAPNSFVGGHGGHGGGHGGHGGHGGGFGASGSHGGGHSKGFGASGGHGGGGFGGQSKGFPSSGHGAGGGGYGGGLGGGHGGGHAISNHIGGSSYGAPPVQQGYGAPEKQTGYYYYYYPVQAEDDKKKEKGFMDKMKKLFEPMMYPWNAMMDYFGYGEDYEYNDYDDSYGLYARSLVSRASQYVPWDAVNEVSNVVTQDECIEYFACQLGSYGREYDNMHFLLEYILPEENIADNSYYRTFKHSVLQKTDCGLYNCPLFRRRQGSTN
ncbi:serine, glycine, tyrosine and glutamine-rich protein-like [Hyalella azteca]|uniref:Serine, glycine, tyrosine and glutamine-rich protein-like n=1 Tax=Hyalella azteca TaxID=294128 RepID=A0A8B7P5F2_HYAAZ|nr:serine, glycine, tyrosine and glutamine-rich protein-like [Hyalella azteca]